MNDLDIAVFIIYSLFASIFSILGAKYNLNIGLFVFNVFVLIGYLSNIPAYNISLLVMMVMIDAGLIVFKLYLTNNGEGMRTSPRDIIMGFSVFVVLTDFVVSFILYGKFVSSNPFPSVAVYFNYGNAWATATNDLGGAWSFLGFSLSFFENFFIGILSLFVFIFNVFDFLYLSVSWFLGMITYPFSLMYYPVNVLFEAIIYLMFGVSIAFALRIAWSGLESD
jgi:hypothetical protein